MGVWGGEVFAFLTNHHTFAAVGAPLPPLPVRCGAYLALLSMMLSMLGPIWYDHGFL